MATRPSASVTTTVKAAVLRDLRAAYPRGRSTIDLLNIHGTCAKTRIGDLTEDGWDIVAEEVDGAPGYRLASMTRGTADPVEWGLRARLGASTGLKVTTYGTSTLVLPEAVEARILARVEAIIKEELAKAKINTGTVDTIAETTTTIEETATTTTAVVPDPDAWLTDLIASMPATPPTAPKPPEVDDIAALFGF